MWLVLTLLAVVCADAAAHVKPSDGCKADVEKDCKGDYDEGPTCVRCVKKHLHAIEEGLKSRCSHKELVDFW